MALIPYILKSFRGGISGESNKGVAGSFKFGYGLDLHGKDDVLTCNQGVATVLDATHGMGDYGGTTITGIFNYFVNASDGSLYAFSSTGSIFARTNAGNWNFVYNDENGGIRGASEWGFDDGTNYLFWATGTTLARKPFPGVNSAPDSGTMRWSDVTAEYKVLLDSVEYHTMKPAGGSLIIANGNTLSELSYAEDFDPYAVSIYPRNYVKCIEDRDDSIIFGTYKDDNAEEGFLWSWVTYVTNFVQKKRIPTRGLNNLITGELPLIQAGVMGDIFFSDFESVVPICRNPGYGYVLPDASTFDEGLALFGFSGSTYPGVWSYGRKQKNRQLAFNYEYRLANEVGGVTSTSTIGAMSNVGGDILISWGNTAGNYGVDQVSSTFKADAVYEGLEFDGGKPYWKKQINHIKVTMSPMAASTGISIKFKGDKESAWRYAILGGGSTTFSVTDATEAIFSLDKPMHVFELGVELTPSANTAPEILSITTYLDGSGYEMA